MRYLIVLVMIVFSSLSVAQPLDDLHLTGLLRGYFGPDTSAIAGGMVKIINLETGHRDSVITNSTGHWSWTGVTTSTGSVNPALPTEMTLSPNYPNPFTGSTTVKFENSAHQSVRLSVYNILGQRVTDLVDKNLRPGGYELTWNGLTKEGTRLAQGIYFLCLNANGKTMTRKIVLLGNSSATGEGIVLRESTAGSDLPNRSQSEIGAVNGTNLDDFSLRLEFHHAGYDSLSMSMTLPDGQDFAFTTNLHRQNSAPTVSAVWISSPDSTDTQPLTGHATSQDAEQDPVFWIHNWQVRGQWLGLNSTMLHDSLFEGGDTVRFRARASDAEAQGAWTESAVFVVRAGIAGMVLIPAGPYSMGSTQTQALPVHTVTMPAFYMDIYEVTNSQYRVFCDSTGHAYPSDPTGAFYPPPYFTNPIYANYPVLNVSWNDARAYAAWAGKRLPTEAEWERAAKGATDDRTYPWGNTWVAANANIFNNPTDGYTYTSPVGSFPNGISPAGCNDMAGNVWEWCEDDNHPSYTNAPSDGSAWVDSPRGTQRILRGGSCYLVSGSARCAYRYSDFPNPFTDYGFRCAKSIDIPNHPPTVPSSPIPTDSAIDQLFTVDLSWTCSDPDSDPVSFDVYFGTQSVPPIASAGLITTTYNPGTLVNNTTYYWRIAARDNHGAETSGPTWTFTTIDSSGIAGMVLVPAGSYNMGATYQTFALPIHTVTLPAFYIDVCEVTNGQYKEFCDATGRAYPNDPNFGMTNYATNPAYANYPAVMVTWYDARAYAEWAGKRLPTEAEWERAAKGTIDNRQWPWGDTWIAANANIANNPADGYDYTAPVGSYPNDLSLAGCHDMTGNVEEWCEDDWHTSYTGAPTDGSAWIDSPRAAERIFRRGSFPHDNLVARCARRGALTPASFFNNVGFRCARNAANVPPRIPSTPIPDNNSINQSVNTTLAWVCSDPDSDPVTFDVYFGTQSVPPIAGTGLITSTYNPVTLVNNTTYYWRIAARDNHGAETSGPTWTFTTVDSSGIPGMVLVPAGPYDMGATYHQNFALPIHTVNVPAFYIDVCEVTNGQYKAFCDATGRAYPDDPNFGMTDYATNPAYANYPAVMVTWYDARAYAEWVGKRLPTEAEWERAAKGNIDNRQWPWGDTWIDANANIANNPADGHDYTAPVGSYPNDLSLAGCHDMTGNVEEWCEDDWHTSYNGAPTDGSAWIDSPRAAGRVFRRGSFPHDNLVARCARRGALTPESFYNNVGFRCAMTP